MPGESPRSNTNSLTECLHYIYPRHKRETEKTARTNRTIYTLIWYTFYDLWIVNLQPHSLHGANMNSKQNCSILQNQLRKKQHLPCNQIALHYIQVAQLWHRARASMAILSGWVILRLNFSLKGYVSHQYLWTVR